MFTNGIPLRSGLGLFKVTENITIQQIIYKFLYVCHCSYSCTIFKVFDIEEYGNLDI